LSLLKVAKYTTKKPLLEVGLIICINKKIILYSHFVAAFFKATARSIICFIEKKLTVF